MRNPGMPLNPGNLAINQSNLNYVTVPGFKTVASATYPGGYRTVYNTVPVVKATYTHSEVPFKKLQTNYIP